MISESTEVVRVCPRTWRVPRVHCCFCLKNVKTRIQNAPKICRRRTQFTAQLTPRLGMSWDVMGSVGCHGISGMTWNVTYQMLHESNVTDTWRLRTARLRPAVSSRCLVIPRAHLGMTRPLYSRKPAKSVTARSPPLDPKGRPGRFKWQLGCTNPQHKELAPQRRVRAYAEL